MISQQQVENVEDRKKTRKPSKWLAKKQKGLAAVKQWKEDVKKQKEDASGSKQKIAVRSIAKTFLDLLPEIRDEVYK